MTEKEKIIEEVLKEFEEKHQSNLRFKGGWDANDIFDYIKECCQKALQSRDEEVLKIIDYLGSLRLYRSKSCQLLIRRFKQKLKENKENEKRKYRNNN